MHPDSSAGGQESSASAKETILNEIWTKVKFQQAPFIFDNDLVTRACVGRYRNPHRLTKLDTLEEVPTSLKHDDVFIAHLGEGRHQFVRGLEYGFHKFEPFNEPPEEKRYARTFLDELGAGEADMLSRVYNQGLIQLFLYGDETVRPRIRLPGRTSNAVDNTFEYTVKDQQIQVSQLQVEMDFIVQNGEDIAIAEAKSGKLSPNFAVAQIFMPVMKLSRLAARLKEKHNVRPLFITQFRKKYQAAGIPTKEYEHIRIYEYRFARPGAMDSLELVKDQDGSRIREYVLVPR